MATEAERREAVAQLIAALSYALLRSFEATARGTAAAPTMALAESQARFAVEEFERFRILRARLEELTSDGDAALAQLRAPLDAFYAQAEQAAWLETQVFHLIGDTVTADFAEMLAPHIDPDTATALRRALTGRVEQQAFAIGQIGEAIEREHEAAHERIVKYAGSMVGLALNRLREALEGSDALEVILGEGGVKEIVIEILGRHRERLERLGIEPVDA